MEKKHRLSKKKKLLFFIIMNLLTPVIFSLAYVGHAHHKLSEMYWRLKIKQRGWKGKVHDNDSLLGFAPIPNTKGAHTFHIGPDIPTQFDNEGFRVPINVDKSSHNKPLVLALGCSFTYGDAIHAKDTFPYLVGRSLGGTSKRPGFSFEVD